MPETERTERNENENYGRSHDRNSYYSLKGAGQARANENGIGIYGKYLNGLIKGGTSPILVTNHPGVSTPGASSYLYITSSYEGPRDHIGIRGNQGSELFVFVWLSGGWLNVSFTDVLVRFW